MGTQIGGGSRANGGGRHHGGKPGRPTASLHHYAAAVQLLPFSSLSIHTAQCPIQPFPSPSLSLALDLVSLTILKISIIGPAKALWRVDLWWEWRILTAQGRLCRHHRERDAWGWFPSPKGLTWPWRVPSPILTPWEEVADWVKSDVQIFSSLEELCHWWQSQHGLGLQPEVGGPQCPWDACQTAADELPRELLVPMYCIWQWMYFTYAHDRFIRQHFREYTRWLTPKWHAYRLREGRLVREDPYTLDGGVWWSHGVPRLRRGALRQAWHAYRHQHGSEEASVYYYVRDEQLWVRTKVLRWNLGAG